MGMREGSAKLHGLRPVVMQAAWRLPVSVEGEPAHARGKPSTQVPFCCSCCRSLLFCAELARTPADTKVDFQES